MVDISAMSNAQVEWNMANLLNIELSNLRAKANSYFIAGKYKQAMDSLIAMRLSCMYAFVKEERDALKDIEKELEVPLIQAQGIDTFNDDERKIAVKAMMVIRKNFPIYNEVLMDALHAHGFLGSFKKDSSMMRI